MRQALIGENESVSHRSSSAWLRLSALRGYALTVVSVAIALSASVLLEHFQSRGAVALLLFGVAVSSWYGGPRSAVLAVILSLLGFSYFIAKPIHSFYVQRSELPEFLIFASFAALASWFSAIRRRIEQDLIQTRDKLKVEKEEVEKRSSLLDLTHDSIFVRDMNFIISYWNRGAEEFYGWKQNVAIGKRSDELLRTRFPKPIEEIRAELLMKDGWEGELARTKADGVDVIVASRWSLRRDSQGSPVAILETSNDITQRKNWEEQIQALNQELATRSIALEASNKELEAFAYSISHDLRAPLRHMAGFAELLRKHAAAVLNEKSQRYVTMILEAANQMGNLIDDLLAFSRISRAETRKSMVDVGQVVQEVVAETRRDATGRNILWKIDELPACYGDSSMLRLVFVNLVSNAVKFTRTRPQAEIEIGCTDPDRGDPVLFVRDNGVGFDMKYSNKLFGVFQRLHPQDAFEGTGVGLATVQRIVHRHGGRVWAESTVDGGATFYFSLPKITGADR